MSGTHAPEIRRVFELQKDFQWKVKQTSAEQRKLTLQKLKNTILANTDAIRTALQIDMRKPEAESGYEINGVLGDIDDAIAHLDDWMKPVEIQSSPQLQGTKAVITYEPRGVCLLFGPWNVPFLLLFQPLVPIIAAGNCAIVKPNEMAPETSRISASIIREAFDEKEIAVFEGDVDLANDLLELPFNHIFFTGSPKVGRAVMAAAARHLASVTLELGGKCPAIIDDTADLAQAAAAIGGGRYYNAGQVCLAPDIAWVREDLREDFLANLRKFIDSTFYVDGKLNKHSFGQIVDARNFSRVKGYLDDAMRRGARLAFGGAVEEADRTIYPSVLIDVPLEAAVMSEEIFGPVLVVMTYKNFNEIVEFMRKGSKPLAMYIFSHDQEFVDQVLLNTSSGGVTVNGWAVHYFENRLPFGGINESGIGRYHGIHGFKELSHERAVSSLR